MRAIAHISTFHWRGFPRVVPVAISLWVLAATPASALTTRYVAPVAGGLGDGSSSNNAAQYFDPGFWNTVRTTLESDNVIVNFSPSNEYGSDSVTRPPLTLLNFGNPLKKLTLSGNSRETVVWSHASADGQKYFIKLEGSQNIAIEKMTFTGNVLSWAVSLVPNTRKPARNIIIDQCTFSNLWSVVYGAVGVSDASRDVRISNCAFSGVGVASTSHMIYGSEACGVTVENCSFIDCVDAYLKIRKDSDYWVVSNCTFKATSSPYDHAFLDICALNSTEDTYDPQDPAEYFGDNIQVTGCSFTAASTGSGVDAVQFRGAGFDAYGFEENGIRLDAQEGNILENGASADQLDVLWDNLGIRGERVVLYGNSFTRIRHPESYVYELAWNSTSAGWVGSADISATSSQSPGTALDPAPHIINGNFEKPGYPSRNWQYNNQNQLIPAPHRGLNGTSTAIFLDRRFVPHQIWQWLYKVGVSWQADFCFALGASIGAGEKFRVDLVHNDIGDKKLSIAVNDLGQIGIYQNSNWQTLANLGNVLFSADGNGDGDYGDPEDTLRWYHLRIAGDYASVPSVAVQISDPNTYALNVSRVETNLVRWVNGSPVAGASSPGCIVFSATACDAIVDEVQLANLSRTPVTNVWIGAGGDDQWSTTGNWDTGALTHGVDVLFASSNAVAPPGSLPNPAAEANNVVNESVFLNSLWYQPSNSWHVTEIPDGISLSVTGALAGYSILAGYSGPGNNTNNYSFASIRGAGRLVVANPLGAMSVRLGIGGSGGARASHLDLSGLDTFTADVSCLLVGAEGSTANNRPGGVLYLARTNVIRGYGADASLIIGDGLGEQGGATNSVVYLGNSSLLFFDSGMIVGGRRNKAQLRFQTAGSPVAIFRNLTGSGRQSFWSIADNNTGGNSAVSVGIADFCGGTLDALVDTVTVARGQTSSTGNPAHGVATGTLIIGAGRLDANAMDIGYQRPLGSAAIGLVQTVGGPSVTNLVVAGSVRLGYYDGLAAASNTVGTLNIGSTVIVQGGITSGGSPWNSVNLTNGHLIVSGGIGGNNGPGNTPMPTLNLESGAVTLDLGTVGAFNDPLCRVTKLHVNSVTINVAGSNLSPGTIPLIRVYGGFPTGKGFTGIQQGTLPVAGWLSNSTDTVYLVIPQPASLTGVTRLTNGNVVLMVTGAPGAACRVLASEDVLRPLNSWTQVAAITLPGDGVGTVIDTNAVAFSRRFYRLAAP